MSFASTPLGQGRRLDHHTFLNKAPSHASANTASSSTQIHATAITHRPHPLRQNLNKAPVSYAYGAPTEASRSPPKPERSAATAQSGETASDSEQPALVRFARLKQQESQQNQNQPPTRVVGPRIINTPPNPDRWSVKDTSVNIATAFHHAATNTIPAYDTSSSSNNSLSTSIHMNPNDSWASGALRKPVLPRSTSVEYEKETQSTVSRRIANPPPRSNLARPPVRVARVPSVRHVPDSEGEDEAATADTRGKSPFEHVMEATRKLVQSAAPTTFFLRRQSEEPESRPVAQDQSTSYDYSAEEREYQAAAQQQNGNGDDSLRRNKAHKRGRISIDNKAYLPPVSDLEDSDGEFGADGKRTRRRKAKKGAAGGPLTSLPIAGYDKRRKKKRGSKENGVDEEESSEEADDEVTVEHVAEQQVRGITPVPRASSLRPPSRQSASRGSIPPNDIDASLDMESGFLHSIPEIEEPPMADDDYENGEVLSQRTFSVGATLGRAVHWIVSLFRFMVASIWSIFVYIPMWIGRSLGMVMDALVFKPIRTILDIDPAPLYQAAKYITIGLGIYAAWYALNSGLLPMPSRAPHHPIYQPPSEIPPSDISELSSRLLRLENALAALSVDTERSRTYIEGDARHQAELAGRMGALETRVQQETSQVRASTSQGIQAIKQEFASLQAQIQRENQRHRNEPAPDEEARAKLRALEARIGTVEGGVREALEASKHERTAPTIDNPTWWENLVSGKTSVTIKSTEGQDVSNLINQLVESAVSKASKDTLARPDFAMYSTGASIIPSLTSDTYEIKPRGITNQLLGLITGHGYAVGRPPVTALHHESHNGHCWPFAGSQGQLGIVLAAPLYISDVTIDHVAREVATDLRSAPRIMELWGLVEGQENIAKFTEWKKQRAARLEEERTAAELPGQTPDKLEDDYPATLPRSAPYMRIANFSYNVHSPHHIQTFSVPQEIQDLGIDFGIVVLLVKNNWGREDFTCLYRVRVHGEPLGGILAPLPEDTA